MIVTDHFVYIHTSRTAGTFLNRLILEYVPGARLIQYHGHLRDLPGEFSDLPVIGFVRNPWDWYLSMFFDYRRKPQFVFRIISDGRTLDFETTVSRFLNLGDNSALSKELLRQLARTAPAVIDAHTPSHLRNPGLRSEHFENFPEGYGYYSWLFQLMYESKTDHRIHIGRFENLREEALRLFELTGTTITNGISRYLKRARVLNASRRPKDFVGVYSPELEQLVADKEKYLVDRFGYECSLPDEVPKTDFFRCLGSANVENLVERVKGIPESQWASENEEKPNKFATLDDTRHIIFRYIDGSDKLFDFHDFPLWDEWKDDLSPILHQAAKSLGYKDYRIPRVMLARLPAGGKISPHTDKSASHFIHKIHVPLITNPETMFQVGKQTRHLPVGEIIEVNNKRVHAVQNHGELDRIHLIFECYNMDDYGRFA